MLKILFRTVLRWNIKFMGLDYKYIYTEANNINWMLTVTGYFSNGANEIWSQ
jgi:hypothetical protein